MTDKEKALKYGMLQAYSTLDNLDSVYLYGSFDTVEPDGNGNTFRERFDICMSDLYDLIREVESGRLVLNDD